MNRWINRSLIVGALWCCALLGCNAVKNNSFSYYYFDHGVYRQAGADSTGEVATLIRGLVDRADETLKLLVSEERIDQVKDEASGIEVIFDSKVSIQSATLGRFEADRMLIPFDGHYVGDATSPIVTIFIGVGSYGSPPLRNSQGLGMLDSLRSVVIGRL